MRLRFMSTVLFAGILSVSICAQTPVGASAITTRASTQPAILTAADRPRIVSGSTLCGLRGRTFEFSELALEDFTRGGTEFKVK